MTQEFQKSLLPVVRGYAGEITKKSKALSESNRVRATIKSRVDTSKANSGVLAVITTAGGANAPDARAREFGSGLHAKRGAKKKIPIVPVNAQALVFPWDKASDLIPRTNDGRVILKKVEHPGIRADNNGKGYIKPAQEIVRPRLNKALREQGAEGIKASLRKAWKVK